jgi:hypothetical protein
MKEYYNDNMNIMCRKGAYPYEWFDDVSKFNHDGLPSKQCFYSKLNQKGIEYNDFYLLNMFIINLVALSF